MTFVTKGDFSLDDYNRVIKKYNFPITDLETAVQFLNELPKNCNVDLPDRIKYGNLYCANTTDADYNLILLCNNGFPNEKPYRVHAIFRDIVLARLGDHHKFVVIRSCKDMTETDLYLSNDIVVLNPTTSYVYGEIYGLMVK